MRIFILPTRDIVELNPIAFRELHALHVPVGMAVSFLLENFFQGDISTSPELDAEFTQSFLEYLEELQVADTTQLTVEGFRSLDEVFRGLFRLLVRASPSLFDLRKDEAFVSAISCDGFVGADMKLAVEATAVPGYSFNGINRR